MQRYTTKEAAQMKADEINSIVPEKICPLMDGKKCKKLCICWLNAYVQTITQDKEHGLKDVFYTIAGPGCTNAMFSTERRIIKQT
jgi:hypothetical protein